MTYKITQSNDEDRYEIIRGNKGPQIRRRGVPREIRNDRIWDRRSWQRNA